MRDNSLRSFLIDGREILLAKFENKYYALTERCTHRGGPLSEGLLEDGVVTCPWHFGQFDLKTGQVLGPPPSEPLQKFEVMVENGDILVSAH